MEEIWKDIKGYEGYYQVSNLGRVQSIKKRKIFRNNKNSRGYIVVTLTKNNIERSFAVHRLVAQTFINNPDNLPQVNHIDGNKQNNKVENLEWCTQKENQIHCYRNNLQRLGTKKIIQINVDGTIIKEWDSITDAEMKLKINHGKISMVCRGKRKTAGGYLWKYAD